MNRQSRAWKKVVILLMLPVLAAFMFAADGNAAATPASSVWSKTLTNSSESSYSIYEVLPLAKTSGYITVGGVYSMTESGAWIMKIGADGAVEWSYTYSGVSIDSVHEVTGGFIAVGYTYGGDDGYVCTAGVDCPDDFIDCEPGFDCPGDDFAKPRKSYGQGSPIMMKVDQYGSIRWQKELSSDSGNSIEITGVKESGLNRYKLSGVTYTMDSNANILVIDVAGSEDSPTLTSTVKSVVVTDDADISVVASEVKLTKDNGYLATGVVSDTSGASDATFIAAIKVNANGIIEWAKKYSLDDDGSSLEFNDVTPVKDGYIATGQTTSADQTEYTNWLAKISTTGAISWVKTFEMADADSTASVYSHGVREDTDGGYITAAMIYDDYAGTYETVIVKLDSNGGIKWQSKLGSDSEQYFAEDIRPLTTGYFIGGVVSSTDNETSSPWFAKLDKKGTTRCTSLASTNLLKTVSLSAEEFPDQEDIKVSLGGEESDITDTDAALEAVEVDSSAISDDGSCTQQSISVEMNLVNNAAGSVKSVPAGINCKSGYCESNASFWPGSEVTLTATATKGSIFTGWYDSEGTKLSSESKYALTVNSDSSLNVIIAEFSKPVAITGVAVDVKNKGIVGAKITVYSEDPETGELTAAYTGLTVAKGKFTIKVAAEEGTTASYIVSAAKTGFTFSPSEQMVEVGDADVALDENFVGHVYSLSGKVYKTNANGEDKPAAKVTVKLVVDTGDVDDNGDPIYQTKGTAKTNSSGTYIFKKVAAGDYIIQASTGTGANMYYGEAYISVDEFDSASELDVVEISDILIELM